MTKIYDDHSIISFVNITNLQSFLPLNMSHLMLKETNIPVSLYMLFNFSIIL